GIRIMSTVSSNLAGGYWDVDNVRLAEIIEPSLQSPLWTNGNFSFTVQSEPGIQFKILSTTNATAPLSNWVQLATVTNTTGATSYTDTSPPASQKYYRAQQLP